MITADSNSVHHNEKCIDIQKYRSYSFNAEILRSEKFHWRGNGIMCLESILDFMNFCIVIFVNIKLIEQKRFFKHCYRANSLPFFGKSKIFVNQ